MITRTPGSVNSTATIHTRLRPVDPLHDSPFELRTGLPNTEAAALWLLLANELKDPSIELDSEAFAIIHSLFSGARRAGAKFCPCFIGLMDILKRQMRDADADSDSDLCVDDGFECDDPDDDRGAGSDDIDTAIAGDTEADDVFGDFQHDGTDPNEGAGEEVEA